MFVSTLFARRLTHFAAFSDAADDAFAAAADHAMPPLLRLMLAITRRFFAARLPLYADAASSSPMFLHFDMPPP